MSTDSVEAEGLTDRGLRVGMLPESIQCQRQDFCSAVVVAIKGREVVGVGSVSVGCPPDAQASGRAFGQGFRDFLQLSSLKPFAKNLEFSSEGFPIINPENYAEFRAHYRGKKMIVMFTTSGCSPCEAIKKAVSAFPESSYVFALVDLDHPRYTSNGAPTEQDNAFARQLGLPKMPSGVPVVMDVTSSPSNITDSKTTDETIGNIRRAIGQ